MALQASTRRRLRRLLTWAVLAWLTLWALLVLLAAVVLPRIAWQPDAVGRWLGERAGLPVQVQAVQAHWTGRGPELQLQGVRLGQDGAVQLGRARLQLAVYTGLLPGQALSRVHLDGLDLRLAQDADGRWRIHGLADGSSDGDPLDALSRLGEIQVSAARLHVQSQPLGIDRRIEQVDLRLRVDGQRVRLGMHGHLAEQAPPLQLVADLDRGRGDGQLWLGSRGLPLAALQPLLRLHGAEVRQGTARGGLWLDMAGWQVRQARTELVVDDILLQGHAGQQLAWDAAELTAHWQRQAAGWALQVPRLRVAGQQMDGAQVVWGERAQLQAPRLVLGPWLQLVGLSEQIPGSTAQWLRQAAPEVELRNVQWHGRIDGRWQGQGELVQVGFAAVGDAPGLRGLAGQFQADEQGLELALDQATPVLLDWPTGFGVQHTLQLDGRIGVWPEQGDWRAGTSALRVQGTDYGAWVRGGLRFHADGRLPRIDLAADLDDAPMTAAKRFWVRSKMSQGAIDWLDAALVGGHVRGGQGLVSGELADWPFDDRNGRFEARARIDDGVFHFADGWADLSAADGEVAFVGAGFELKGRGRLGAVDVPAFSARIARFSQPELEVRARGDGQAQDLLGLLRDSPLHQSYGTTLDALQARGEAAVSFALDRALHRAGAQAEVSGTVELKQAVLADPRWDVRLEQVSGRAEYGNDGFTAPALQARLDGNPVTVALHAGRYTDAPGQAFQARVDGSHDMAQLLARAPELGWLGHYLRGRSHWKVGVDVPVDAGTAGKPMAVLNLDSDLVGTTMALPAPLSKPAGQALGTRVRAALPMGSGPLEIGFGQQLGLLVRQQGQGMAVLATLGSGQAQGALPVAGLKVNGRTPQLDALGWIGVVRGGQDSGAQDEQPGGDALALREIDLLAAQLELAGGVFPDTRLRLTPGNARLAVQLDGPALAGQIAVPDAQGATVVGSLSRLHWRNAAAAVAGEGVAVPAEPMDPAQIPPLALQVADLRVADRPLGSALLRSRQLVDGLQVDVLQLRRKGQVIDLQGSWRGRGAQGRTALQMQVDSQDFGELFGAQGQLRGGQGQLTLAAAWPGGPQDFSLARLDGRVQLDARNGQLLEVDPGAGRVLGLLSLAQLPRRMLLDFRDLYSRGLAFNQVQADVVFGQGSARSQGIVIDSPAADIRIHGQADLAAQQFDQVVEVDPHSGNLLTVVGAVAGGPVGAAVGAAANAVLAKPLSGLGARTYHVTGPWKDPQVQVIDRSSPSRAVGHDAPVAPVPTRETDD